VSAICYSSIKGLAMRVTRLDPVGAPVEGLTSAAVSKGFVSVGITANIEDGEEFTVKNAAGELCISERDNPLLKWLELSIEFCQVDPEMFELMTGGRLLEDFAGNSVGFTMSETYVAAPFALEVWTKVAGTVQEGYQWIYWLFPMVINGILGDLTLENGPVSFTLAGNTKSNGSWASGPYDVVAVDAQGTCGPLTDPVLPGEHLYHRLTTCAPPTAKCGYVEVTVSARKDAVEPGDVFVDPAIDAQDASNATELSTLGYAPATPTEWTTGQSFTVSGFLFNWTGTAWAPGAHA